MGLCKCPKRKVTNLFCFVHRVNVCEDCMLTDHSRCTVQSYLKWLEDSDFTDVCHLCTHSILQGPLVRLTCYDLFHEDCLKSYATEADNCPKCKELIIPPNHFVSPVADLLRRTLETTSQRSVPSSSVPSSQRTVPSSSQRTVPSSSQRTVPSSSQRTVPSSSQRSVSSSSQRTVPSSSQRSVDYDDKYKKVWSARQWLRDERSTTVLDSGVYRFLCAVGLVIFVALLLILVLTRVGRQVANQDTSLDWNFNTQLKTGN